MRLHAYPDVCRLLLVCLQLAVTSPVCIQGARNVDCISSVKPVKRSMTHLLICFAFYKCYENATSSSPFSNTFYFPKSVLRSFRLCVYLPTSIRYYHSLRHPTSISNYSASAPCGSAVQNDHPQLLQPNPQRQQQLLQTATAVQPTNTQSLSDSST